MTDLARLRELACGIAQREKAGQFDAAQMFWDLLSDELAVMTVVELRNALIQVLASEAEILARLATGPRDAFQRTEPREPAPRGGVEL